MIKYFIPILSIFIFVGCENTNFDKTEIISNPYPAPVMRVDDQNEYINAINSVRSSAHQCGATLMPATSKLKWDGNLYTAAYEHTNDMAILNFVSDMGSGAGCGDWTGTENNKCFKSTPEDRARYNDYNFKVLAQSVAGNKNLTSAKLALEQMMQDEQYCKEIMSPKYRDVALAHIKRTNTSYLHFWTLMLGDR